jgi:acetyl esterase/lipase
LFKQALRIIAIILGLTFMGLVTLVFVTGRPPAPRPDLVRLPEAFPEPPVGYATRPLMALALYAGRADLMEIPEERLPAGVTEELDVTYGSVNDRTLKLDVFRRAEEPSPVPGVIFVHGGAWSGGDKSLYHYYASRIAAEGYVGISVGYRLSGEAPFPAAAQDVHRAVRWVRKHAADYSIDPDRLYLVGGSAGAHLALLAAYAPDHPALKGPGLEDVSGAVSGVMALYGPADLTVLPVRDAPAVKQFLNVPFETDTKRYELASPLTHFDAGDPQTVVVHGTIDAIVPVTQSDRLVEKLKNSGHPYWYDRLDGWPHSLDVARLPNQRVLALLERFLEEGIE